MRGNARDEPGNGKPDATRADRLTFDFRRRRLRLCARICALLVALFSATLLIAGLGVPLLYAIVGVVVQCAAWSWMNRRAATHVEDNAPLPGLPGRAPGLPMWRYGWALGAAVIAGFLAVSWWFDHDIEARRLAVQEWDVKAHVVQDEVDQLHRVVDTPLPSVATDPQIVSLRGALDQALKDYPRIRDEVVCEADGTCGSGEVGKRGNYEEKVQRRDQLKADIEVNLPLAIAHRTEAVKADITTEQEAKAAAESRLNQISTELGPRPEWSGRWDMLNEFASAQRGLAVMVVLAAGLLHFVLDVLALQGAVHWICSRKPSSSSVKDPTRGENDTAAAGSGGPADNESEPQSGHAPSDGKSAPYELGGRDTQGPPPGSDSAPQQPHWWQGLWWWLRGAGSSGSR